MRIMVSFMFFVMVYYLKPRGSFVDILCTFYGAIMLHIYQNPIYCRDEGWMPVTRMLQLNMELDLFQIKTREELLDCGTANQI